MGKRLEPFLLLRKEIRLLTLSKGTTTLKSVDVAVSDDAVVASRKVETSSPSADLALDVVAGTTDGTVDLVLNQYNAGGFLIGAETNYTNNEVKGTKYTVSSSDEKVATIAVGADGTITVTGKSKGTATVVIKEGTVTRATAVVTVNHSTPTITAVNFEEVKDVVTTGALNAQALKSEGITLSSTDYKAEIAANGTIFIDVKGSTEGLDAKNILS